MSVVIEELPNDEPSVGPSTHTEPHTGVNQRAAVEEPEFHEAEETLRVEEPEEHFADCLSDEEGVTDVSANQTSLHQEDEAQALEAAEQLKQQGNELYAAGDLEAAKEKYAEALQRAPETAKQQRAVYAANRAAVQIKQQCWKEAIRDCTDALEMDPEYIKALLRRATAYEALDDLEHTLADYQKVAELQASNTTATSAVRRLTPIVEKKREEMKEEMMGKLKDLGNTVLGKFGMSLDNFKAVKDPNTGSYSINFQQ